MKKFYLGSVASLICLLFIMAIPNMNFPELVQILLVIFACICLTVINWFIMHNKIRINKKDNVGGKRERRFLLIVGLAVWCVICLVTGIILAIHNCM